MGCGASGAMRCGTVFESESESGLENLSDSSPVLFSIWTLSPLDSFSVLFSVLLSIIDEVADIGDWTESPNGTEGRMGPIDLDLTCQSF